jgi:hypothetical protein
MSKLEGLSGGNTISLILASVVTFSFVPLALSPETRSLDLQACGTQGPADHATCGAGTVIEVVTGLNQRVFSAQSK